jgi:hypothetical protein
MDHRGQPRLVFCLVKCDQDPATAAARLLLETNKDVLNRYTGTKVPPQALADHAHHMKDPAAMMNASKCPECCVNTEPIPTAGSQPDKLPEKIR